MPVGSAQIELEGEIFGVSVLFGTDTRNILIAVITLETFGWAADVKNRHFVTAELTL